jgi:hypothetical protein
MSDVLIRIWANASKALFCWHIKVISSTQTLNSQLNIQLKFNCLLNYDNRSSQPRKGNINIATIVILFCSAEPHKYVLFTFNCKEFSWESRLRCESHSFRQEGRSKTQKIVSRLRWTEKSKHTLYMETRKWKLLSIRSSILRLMVIMVMNLREKNILQRFLPRKVIVLGVFRYFLQPLQTNAKVYSRRTGPHYSECFFHLTSLTVTTKSKVKIIFKNIYKFQLWKSNTFSAF